MDFNYVLFTHFPARRDRDGTLGKPWKELKRHAMTLGEILKDEEAPGMLVIFSDPGWLSLLNTIGADFDPVRMTREFKQIDECEGWVQEIIDAHDSLRHRLRLITAKSLSQILNNLRGDKPGQEASRLRRFLVGQEPGVRYDTTKVVEAIVRIRHLGSGVPVLRMDWDTLLNPHTLERLLGRATLLIPRHCQTLAKDHRVHSYLVSGTYVRPQPPVQAWTINDFNTAYATRIFPALIPTPHACAFLDEQAVTRTDDQGRTTCIDGDLTEQLLEELARKGLFDRSVMTRYYGLDGAEGLSRIGSNTEKSVISGAGLVLSDGAILDLPPFSNFDELVMWIDDHQKYELHKALGHLPDENLYEPKRSASLFKDRLLPGQGNLRAYTLGTYLPTLFWGVIMDAWIRGEPPAPNQPSLLVKALERSLKRGVFEMEDRQQLGKDLERIALERINKAIELWTALKTKEGDPSFAALWISGDRSALEQVMGTRLSPQPPDWIGWGLLEEERTRITALSQLREPVRKNLLKLIDDTCTYIEWTLEWPRFVQSVRAIRNGTLQLDVQYEPPGP